MEKIIKTENKDIDNALKDDFLAAYHSIIFSRTSEDNVNVERRCLAIKYLTARKFHSEETAVLLLSQGLKQYETLLEQSGIFKESNAVEKVDRPRWRSSLKDPGQAFSLVDPWPCQKKSTDPVCGRRDPVDRDVENLIRLVDQEDEEDLSHARKASKARSMDGTSSFSRREPENLPQERYSRYRDSRTGNYFGSSGEDKGSRKCEPGTDFSRPEIENTSRQWNANQRLTAGPSWAQAKPRVQSERKNRWEKVENEENEARITETPTYGTFRTAKAELHVQQQQRRAPTKTLGGKASVNSRFVCPLRREKNHEEEKTTENRQSGEPEDERLKGIDEKLIELVRNEIMDSGAYISWDDVAGLEQAKKIIKEIVVLPMLRPDIFTGLRRPPKGILLFGPPGTGKTLIGKCIASQSKSTFFSISASSLTSKWIGEGEKMVRALFAVARVHEPSVIFIDEIDSLLTQRSETEHESSRRIKTEFLVQLDGAGTGDEDRVLVIGATNRPQELDEAARRRFVKRLYVPLPELEARRQIVVNLLAAIPHALSDDDIDRVAQLTEHYSGADMTNLCKEASMGPIRSIPFDVLENIRKEEVRSVTADDFDEAIDHVRPSVSHSDLGLYVTWDRTYGSGTATLAKK